MVPVRSATLLRHRIHWLEPVFFIAALLVYFVYPQYLAVATGVLIMVLFALSYDLVIGFAGILTGDDGLTGFAMAPLFGTFRWSMFGHTKYLYVLGWLVIVFYLLRRVVASPFGVALQGIRENRHRMQLVGTPVLRYLVVAYVLSAAVAGIAGALWAQTGAFVGLDVLALDVTIDGLVMVVLGGIGTLHGSLLGAPLYLLVKHFARQWSPDIWFFAIGALLILIVRFGHGGVLGLWAQYFPRPRKLSWRTRK